ncbi:MAG: protein translocase subunit SecF, partial [Treponema sp.]|nr:protein translocase subunit SecF [Treponema sp.]
AMEIGLGQAPVVQSIGAAANRHFMIRIQADDDGAQTVGSDQIVSILEGQFGQGHVVVLRSDFVGSRFAGNLTDQIGILIAATLLLVLAYASIRFRLQYAVGAVLGIIHDGIVVVAFVVVTGMEFNTTTIAAILTILGYSTNNTIVVFDRIRENRRLFPDEAFIGILDRSLSETLNRTIITTVTTMLAVMSLFIFTTGAMQDFALALMVGMVSGVYTTTFIVTGFMNFWETQKAKKTKRGFAEAGQGKSALSRA